ncbi:MAG: pyruvate kinase, partial [Clostridiales bacterium]|nr:pyruvate kinase [Clostridiales bacterium]
MRKKTKIICTIGPASESPAVLKKLVKGGANVFRLNFSHGDHAEHAKRIQDIQTLRKEMNMPIGIMLDTKGPEIRIKTFQQTPVELAE